MDKVKPSEIINLIAAIIAFIVAIISLTVSLRTKEKVIIVTREANELRGVIVDLAKAPAPSFISSGKSGIILTDPALKEKNRWNDTVVEEWTPIGGEPPDSLYQLKGRIENAPLDSTVDIRVFTNRWWPQNGGKISPDGTWEGSVYIRKGATVPTIIELTIKDSKGKEISKRLYRIMP